ncbi:MAG TPA: cupin domain-containing protein [Bellilinea sp.]|nr:cupin domain-containing protein [Bellilinea sp.]
MTIRNRENSEHRIWGNRCDAWDLVMEKELSITSERMPPNTTEAEHSHKKSKQFFYILSGKARLYVDGKPYELSAGEGVVVNPGLWHKFCNPSFEEVNYLVISSPMAPGDKATR